MMPIMLRVSKLVPSLLSCSPHHSSQHFAQVFGIQRDIDRALLQSADGRRVARKPNRPAEKKGIWRLNVMPFQLCMRQWCMLTEAAQQEPSGHPAFVISLLESILRAAHKQRKHDRSASFLKDAHSLSNDI